MVGRIKFYLPEKRWGFITGADGVDTFFSEDQLSSGFQVQQDVPVEFDIKVDPANWKQYATNVRCLSASEVSVTDLGVLSRFVGKVLFFHERKFGRIEYYDELSNLRTIFFHLNDVQAAEDGLQYEPVSGAVVEFDRSIRWGRELATRIVVTSWPEVEQSPEEYFLSLEDEQHTSEPEPAPITEQQSVLLNVENRKKTLLELIRERKN